MPTIVTHMCLLICVKCYCRNITELTTVVTNAAFYFKNLFQTLQNGSLSASSKLLEDYDNCGVRNNDTFNFLDLHPDLTPDLGSEATADWSVECLWDCTWKENPYMSKTYSIDLKNTSIEDFSLGIFISMPKVPVDLRCLDKCTDTKPPTYFYGSDVWNCSAISGLSFLQCYVFFTQYNVAILNGSDYGVFVSKTYFHLAVEACYLALLEPSLYPNGTCDQLGVNLRVYNPYLPDPPYLFGSLSSEPNRLEGPGTEEVVAIYGAGNGFVPNKNRQPWLCSLRTPGYHGQHRCGVTMLSGPPKPTIFVSAAHCNYLCKDQRGRSVELCCCREAASQFSCAGSDFCGNSSSLQPALPEVM
jgi:hypothetical protein